MTVLPDTSFLINFIISVQPLSNFLHGRKGLQGSHTWYDIAMCKVHEPNWRFIASLFWGSSGIGGFTNNNFALVSVCVIIHEYMAIYMN